MIIKIKETVDPFWSSLRKPEKGHAAGFPL